MLLIRTLLVAALVLGGPQSWAQSRPKPRTAAKARTVAETEARNETLVPGFSGQVREARRITDFLLDALVLSNAQRQALEVCTVAERAALALAVTDVDAAQARWQYQLAVRRVLAPSQVHVYTMLYRQLAGTMLPLDGTEMAAR